MTDASPTTDTNQFADRLLAAIFNGDEGWLTTKSATVIRDAVLDMPELEAIRKLLKSDADAAVRGFVSATEADRQRRNMLARYVPPSVVEWVLS